MRNIHKLALPNGSNLLIRCEDESLAIGAERGVEEWWVCNISVDSVAVWPNSSDGPRLLAEGLASGMFIGSDKHAERVRYLTKFIELWDSTPECAQEGLSRSYGIWCKENGMSVISAQQNLKILLEGNKHA